MENTPVKYMGLVTRRPEPVVISKEQYDNLCKIKIEYEKLLVKLESLNLSKKED